MHWRTELEPVDDTYAGGSKDRILISIHRRSRIDPEVNITITNYLRAIAMLLENNKDKISMTAMASVGNVADVNI
jgi:hypothetical protein